MTSTRDELRPPTNIEKFYVAALRRRAIELNRNANMTPGALMRADSELIQKLVLSNSKIDALPHQVSSNADQHNAPLKSRHRERLLVVVVVSVILAGLLLILPDPTANTKFAMYAAAFVLCSVAVFLFAQGQKSASQMVCSDYSSRLESLGISAPVSSSETSLIEIAFNQLEKARAELYESQRLLSDFSEAALVALNKDGDITETNLTFSVFLDTIPELLAHKNFCSLLIEGDRFLIAQKLNRTSSFEAEFQLLKEDGIVLYCQGSFEWSDSFNQYFACIHDITARKEVENVKQEFKSMITHDLRAPLASLNLLLGELVSEDALADEQRQLALAAKGSAKRMFSMVESLLDLYSADEGTLKLKQQIIPVSAIVEASVENLCGAIRETSAKLTTHFSEELGDAFVLADHERSIQILTNLISNAMKHCPQGTHIELAVGKSDGYPNHVKLSVADNGPGILPERMATIFDRFAPLRAESDGSSRGLGLANCKILVEAQNGKIGVDSRPGKGCTFWFTLLSVNESSIDELVMTDQPVE